jgi:esterase/lipase
LIGTSFDTDIVLTLTETISRPSNQTPRKFPIESLLSARLMLAPNVVDDRAFFLSDSSGALSLYSMKKEGSIPQPLLPGGMALVNPHLMIGDNYVVLPKMGKIMVMIDELGNENYQPSFIPLEGGLPESILGTDYENEQLASLHCDIDSNIAYLHRDDRKRPEQETLVLDLDSRKTISLGRSLYGNFFLGSSKDNSSVILADGYTAGDNVLFLWRKGMRERELLYGTPIEKRVGRHVPPSGIGTCSFVSQDRGLVFPSALFHDEGGATFLSLDNPAHPVDMMIEGLQHSGTGELVNIRQVEGDIFVIEYNIDGASWAYEAKFRQGSSPSFAITKNLVGQGQLSGGVLLGLEWQVRRGEQPVVEYILAFTKANMPSQLYLYPWAGDKKLRRLSNEKVLGIPERYLSEGEDVSYKSFDGLRISSRLYLPSKELGFTGPRPLVEYVHGGPQGQERPDFTWFSMPLIQHLTLNGFAVFVPNVRGSTGYGMKYMKYVDRDWGGDDVKDHLEGLKRLENDSRIDSTRRGVVGRSYGGYMTLTLTARHPSLWKAGVDMFGPYDLPAWVKRLPPSWLPYVRLAIGDPEKDHEFLVERSPKTYFDKLTASLMIIQGKNDPRVPEPESAQVAADLKRKGVHVDYVVFEDEGHDVLRYKNRVVCYNGITEFFLKHLAA